MGITAVCVVEVELNQTPILTFGEAISPATVQRVLLQFEPRMSVRQLLDFFRNRTQLQPFGDTISKAYHPVVGFTLMYSISTTILTNGIGLEITGTSKTFCKAEGSTQGNTRRILTGRLLG